MTKITKTDKPHYKLYQQLISEVLRGQNNSLDRLHTLMNGEQYVLDEAFSLVIDTCIALNYEILGEYTKAMEYVDKSIIAAERLEYWELLVYNYNTRGNIFIWISMYDKALESFLKIIRIEREYKLVQMTAAAYSNIALIYNILDDEMGLIYCKMANNFCDAHKDEMDRYAEKKMYTLNNYVEQLCKNGHSDKAEKYLLEFKSLIDQTEVMFPKAIYKGALMYYSFGKGDITEAVKHYHQQMKQYDDMNNETDKFRVTVDFILACDKLNADPSYYIPELLAIDAEKMMEKHPQYMIKALSVLLKYYKKNGNEEKILETYDAYYRCSEINTQRVEEHHTTSLNVIFKSDEMNKENAVIKQKNTNLNELTAKLKMQQIALENSQNQLSLILDIGKKITSSRSLSEIYHLIYETLKEKLPMTVFALFTKNHQLAKLESVAFFEDDKRSDRITVALDNKQSLAVHCFLTEELIVRGLSHVDDTPVQPDQLIFSADRHINSLIYMPIKYKNDVVGVITFQHRELNAFTMTHIRFIKLLEPYLAISVSNAIYAKRLERLSSHDELTQIYNRRQFDKVYSQLIERAEEEKIPVAVFMMDIDRFKAYNDTYGHLDGDRVLIKVAHGINALFNNENCVFARFGGEEFIGVVVGIDYEAASEKAELIRRTVFDLDIENEKTTLGKVSISVGVAALDCANIKFKSKLMTASDQQLYIAKQNGRNQVAKKLLTEK